MRMFAKGAFAVALSLGLAAPVPALADDVLFENVRIFDGKGDVLSEPTNVLVRGNVITAISSASIDAGGAERIDGGGRTLMPGLIDAHWHTMLVRPTAVQAIHGDFGLITLMAGAEAADTLMRGFTTVRDMGGPSFGLKAAIDAGIVWGPRIYPSGALITVTSGHGDFRQFNDLPRLAGRATRMEEIGGSMVADGPDEVLMRVREQLMQGASQIKLTGGGGVASPHSPLDVATFTPAELRAAVDAARNWGTYVAVHAYTPVAVQRAIEAGVQCIEHAHLIDDETAALIAEKGIWLSTQPFLDDEDAIPFPPGSGEAAKQQQILTGTDSLYAMVKKHGIKVAFGTDTLFSKALADRQGAQLAKMVRWFTPAETLRMATSTNGELLQLSGLRNPYPGRLGVVEEGALADLLLVEGNPIEDINLVADPVANFKVIMKNGKIYKNTLDE